MPSVPSELTADFVLAEHPWIDGSVRANGIKFHTVEYPTTSSVRTTGSSYSKPPLMVFTHGFAENWKVFASQLQFFAQLGYRAVAYDARGYGATDKPPRGYDAWSLAADIKGIIHALGYEEAIIVASDDGGISSWTFAALHPQMCTALVVLSSPHPLAMVHSAKVGRNFRFLLHWLRYQVPFLSERDLAKNNAAAVKQRLRRFGYNPWLASPDFTSLSEYMCQAMSLPNVSKHAVKRHHWVFRSAFHFEGRRYREALNVPITVPVLSIRGTYDDLISTHSVTKTHQWAPSIQHQTIEAGHFPYLEQPERTNGIIKQFLSSSVTPSSVSQQ